MLGCSTNVVLELGIYLPSFETAKNRLPQHPQHLSQPTGSQRAEKQFRPASLSLSQYVTSIEVCFQTGDPGYSEAPSKIRDLSSEGFLTPATISSESRCSVRMPSSPALRK